MRHSIFSEPGGAARTKSGRVGLCPPMVLASPAGTTAPNRNRRRLLVTLLLQPFTQPDSVFTQPDSVSRSGPRS